ncbi:hypothetical protein MP638_004179 [Amoeboaphelidium occidentale]|nr:hypothetical protein MP638_004179 [Amoeboaphelidium occidentale]
MTPDILRMTNAYIRAILDFRGHSPMELSVNNGELLQVIRQEDQYWYLAYDANSQQQGFVPINHFKEEEQENDSCYDSTIDLYFESQSDCFNSQNDLDMKVCVLDYTQLDSSTEWVFVLEVKYKDNPSYLLKRTYQDFYRFHMSMLRRFPGCDDNGKRIIPFMVGPEKNISLASAKQRAEDMNVYVKQLCNLPLDMRSKSDFIKFFNARVGDNSEKLLNYDQDNSDDFTDEQDSLKQTKLYSAASVKAKIKYGTDAFGLRISEDTRYEAFKRKIFAKFSLKPKNMHRICLHLHSNKQPLIINDDIDLKEAVKHLQQGRAYFFIL